MQVIKSGQAVESAGIGPTAEELEAINRFAKAALAAEEVFTFAVLLCDNEVDRDFERFSEETLNQLRELFVGKTGIADHDWRTQNQMARIYRTELVKDAGRKTSLGTPYQYVKGWAYMLRNEGSAQCIAEIQGGIKRETSVGCAVAKRICSVCGKELGAVDCGHIPGREYGGKLCFAELQGAVDAYEWSFVAVPAQRQAGVLKGFGADIHSLRDFVEKGQGAAFAGEYARLTQEAALGRKYLDGLRQEVLRLSLLCDRNLHKGLEQSSKGMDEEALQALKMALECQAAEKLPWETQLPGRRETTAFDGAAYRV